MANFEEELPKTTDGVVDPVGQHYSRHNWKGGVKLRQNSRERDRTSNVIIGITDYEYFSYKKHCGRRAGHRHFFIRGSPQAVYQIVDIFKAAIPAELFRDAPDHPDVRKWWPMLAPGTVVPQVTVAEAQQSRRGAVAEVAAALAAAPAAAPEPVPPVPGPAAPAPALPTAAPPRPPLARWDPVTGSYRGVAVSPAPAAAPAAAPAVASPSGLDRSVTGSGASTALPLQPPPVHDVPRTLAAAHPDDQEELAGLLIDGLQKNMGVNLGTGSGPTDLPAVLAEVVAQDIVVPPSAEDELAAADWDCSPSSPDARGVISESEAEDQEDQEENEEPRGAKKP